MRLSESIIKKLRVATERSFGNVPVYLFGSRVDDDAISGDIDLAIDIELERDMFRKKKAIFGAELIRMDFTEINVDMVLFKPDDALLAKEIQKKAIRIF